MCMYVCVSVCICVFLSTCMRVRVSMCERVWVWVYMCICLCVCACVCVCVCVCVGRYIRVSIYVCVYASNSVIHFSSITCVWWMLLTTFTSFCKHDL